MKTWEFQDVYINAFAACAGPLEGKGLKGGDVHVFHAAPEPGGRPEADCPHDQPGADGAPALGRGGLSGGISL